MSRRKDMRWQCTFDRLEARRLLSLSMISGTVSAVQLTPFTSKLAVLLDTTNPSASPTSFTVTINWADGTSSNPDITSGTVTGPTPAPGSFVVSGSHTYALPGTYSPTITVKDSNGSTASVIGEVDVSALPFTISVNTIKGAPGASVPATGTVALFLSPDSADQLPSDFTALINWGDGQTTIGTVAGGPTAFTVSGNHTYALAGSYATTVTVATSDGLTSFGQGTATISVPTGYTGTSQPIVTPVAQLFSGTVATFADANPNDLASIFTASINWGNGGTAPATVTGENGSFAVQGTYTYTTAGTYPVTVTVSDQSGNSFTVADTATVTTSDDLSNSVSLTGGLAQVSANGPNAANGYTDTDEPTFSGTTVAYGLVSLYARLSGVDATTPLGEAVATASGTWTLTSGPLTDGVYSITATVTPPAGSPSDSIPLADNGRVVIDTVSPVVVKESVVGPGRVVVSFRDDLSGMDTSTLLNASNYTFAGNGVTAVHPTKVTLLPSGNLPTDAQSVLLTIKGKRRLLRQIRALRISGTNPVSVASNVTLDEGITDNAGNALQGNAHSAANPASGRAAGNYVVKIAFPGSI